MENTFQISDPSDQTLGDYLSFVISDRDGTVPASISGTALRILAGTDRYKASDVFADNKERIRIAAYKSRRMNPTLTLVALGSNDFTVFVRRDDGSIEFEYTRQQGAQRTYHVRLTLMKRSETGQFTYSALIHCGGDYRGPAKVWPLVSTAPDEAEAEASVLVQRDIENLVGIDE